MVSVVINTQPSTVGFHPQTSHTIVRRALTRLLQHCNTYTCFCLTEPFFWSYCRVRPVPKPKLSGIVLTVLFSPGALPVAQYQCMFVGHAQLNRHLSIMGVVNDPSCNQCGAAIESASHFLCQCDRFITTENSIGKIIFTTGRYWPRSGQGFGEICKKISQIHPEAAEARL